MRCAGAAFSVGVMTNPGAGRKITEKLSGDALREATGRDWGAWFAVLDERRATELGHTEIARQLRDDLGVDGWYAQSITVGYEQERGLRVVGQSSGGTWEASGSKTVDVPAVQVSRAFVDEELRRRWLPDAEVTVRTHRPGKSVTADFRDAIGGASRISVFLTVKGPRKTQVGVGHHKLPDAEAVVASKQFWRERLTELKTLLESAEGTED